VWPYLADREDLPKSDPLFAADENQFLDRDPITKILDRIAERAGVEHVYPHRFRHTFAVEFLRNGDDIFTLQELLGHRSLTMVRHYLTLSQTDLENAHKKASPVDNWRL
jgi:integrase/recombinase XerD